MAVQRQRNVVNKRWLFRCIILSFCCISVSQQYSISPIANSLDPDWLLHMNYTRYVTDMRAALESNDTGAWAEKISSMLDLHRVKRQLLCSLNSKASCFACKFVINLIRAIIKTGKSNAQVANEAGRVCTILGIQSANVCMGIMRLVGIEVIYVIRHSNMHPAQMCSFFLGETCFPGDDPRHNWKVTFPSLPKPSVHPVTPPGERVPRLKVLQISDTHYDPHYLIGGNTDCGEPLCCRASNGPPASSATAAGKWGNYKCDSPKWLIQNTFQHIIDTHKDIDYIMWTGDIPPHDSWNQTREGNLQNLKDTVEMVATYFKGIPVFPSIGNHESCPVDSYPPPFAPSNKNMSWLYDELNHEWSRWLPAETSKTIKRGAFYSTLVKPGLRIISINGNYCNRNNFWLLLNSTDPVGELAWLIDELQAAENKSEKVHIIGHVPPGESDCVKVWSKNYYDIINRYEGTIMAQFYGHTHYDEFEVFYDTKDLKRPLNVGYIAPSVTPWENVNPSYRIYYVDGDHSNTSRSIIDYETWKMDLDEANQNGEPVWYKAYTARRAYNMSSLLPKDWDELIKRMAQNEDLFDIFHRNYFRDSPMRPSCDESCKKNLLCKMKSGRSHDEVNLCHGL
ncbi:sphingomyelin phosphodiesterase-like [Copidosoma floridanum]|uniref:sphingomyelin phosphodiesterase-like n=1 Tax=Copidosoma floridanum TaxID=29053 RepID=UPI0006C9DD8F|nr:sphingomyelin phosphodiesterase-like [Copidosoma floridanum]